MGDFWDGLKDDIRMALRNVATTGLSSKMRKHARVREMSIKISLIPVNLSVLSTFSVDDGFWSSGSEEGRCKPSNVLCSTADCLLSGTSASDGP